MGMEFLPKNQNTRMFSDTNEENILETELANAADPLGLIEALETSGTQAVLNETGSPSADTAEGHEEGQSVLIRIEAVDQDGPKPARFGRIRSAVAFSFHYIAVSAMVFFVLLGATNYSAYETVVSSWFFPESVQASSESLSEDLGKSKITVYADGTESGSESPTAGESEAEAEEIRKKLEESNVTVKENILAPKKLIPAKPQLSVDFDITPYENRIIIPKIGKNVPLVDVEPGSGFDFDHMENIFMKELEKGIVRYPWTAKPGQNGNAFIFGHSSNYPWIKGDYNQVFTLLDQVKYGDEIVVYYNQKKFTYVVREKKIVKPGDVKVLNRDDTKKELSLMTCWPIGTTLKRMIVFAEIKEDTPVK